jgi:hypothetical protein
MGAPARAGLESTILTRVPVVTPCAPGFGVTEMVLGTGATVVVVVRAVVAVAARAVVAVAGVVVMAS